MLDVPVNDPNFGVLITCACKQKEKMERRTDELRRMSNLDNLRDKTFSTFDQSVPGVERAYKRAWEYARSRVGTEEEVRLRYPWLVLFGNNGSGKTHLAAAIANALLDRHWPVLFASVPDLLDHLRSTFGPNSEIAYDMRFETIRDVPLLVLDDLGTENTTPWAREKLYQIINHRYNSRLSTVITSNRNPEDIEKRILSRMTDCSLINEEITMLDAEDYRLRKMEDRFPQYKRSNGRMNTKR